MSATRSHSNVNPYPPGTLVYESEELRLAWRVLVDAAARALGIGRLLGWLA